MSAKNQKFKKIYLNNNAFIIYNESVVIQVYFFELLIFRAHIFFGQFSFWYIFIYQFLKLDLSVR